MVFTSRLRLFLATLALSLVASAPSLAAASTASVDLAAPGFAARAAALEIGERLDVVAPLAGLDASALELERFQVWTDDARVVIHEPTGDIVVEPASRVFLRGGIAGVPGSRAALSVSDDGAVRGLVAADGSWWIVGDTTRAGRLEAATTRALDDELLELGRREMTCGSDGLRALPEGKAHEAAVDLEEQLLRPLVETLGGVGGNTARVAIETDTAFLDRFNDSTAAATSYVGDLFAFISTIYDLEVSTDLQIQSLSLWTSTDPWNQTSANCGLFEFGRYWNQNNSDVDRTIAHFLSGRSSLSGIAWVGVLCNGGFNTTIGGGCPGLPSTGNYGGDYGYTSGISGSFDLDNPTMVWDMVAVAHEIGHNFNSPHTHCYAGLGGNGSPVDTCFSGQCGTTGCWCGGQSLPCTGQSGCGTLMSYCHLLGGGLNNMSPTFGLGHPFGVEPERVPERMASHVATRSIQNPGCLDRQAGSDDIFSDGFESGNTSSWD